MTLGRSGERASGKHADADDADAGRRGMIEQPSIILCRIIHWQRSGGGRIEHIVDRLSAVEGTCVDHLVQRRCLADCGEPKKPRLALLAQSLKRRHYITEHLSDAERFPPVSVIALCRWKMSTRSRRSRARLPSSDFATASPMLPKSPLGSRTLVPTARLAGLSLCRTRPRFFSDSPLPYCTVVS